MDTSNWSFDRLMAFTIVHCAFADLELTEAERNFLDYNFNHDDVKHALSAYANCADHEKHDTLLTLKAKHVTTNSDRDKVLALIEAAYNADRIFNNAEKNHYQTVKTLLS